MNILVTGGAGFIGSHLSTRLLELGHRVTALDNFNDYYDPKVKRDNVAGLLGHKRYQLIEGDIVEASLVQRLFAEQKWDGVVHLAARAGVRPSIQEPHLYYQVNLAGTLNLLEGCRLHQIKKFIFASSSSVYGDSTQVPFKESAVVDFPISPYAATKKAGELMCYTYHHLYGISTTCLRFFTVYGPRQRPDMAIHKFTRLIYDEKPVPFFGDGTSRRDYTYIDDILHGVLAALAHCNGYHIYNLGESKTVELRQLIQLLEESLQKKAKLQYLPDQPGDVPITCADITSARVELNYNPKTTIEQGIPRFVAWFKERQKTPF